MNREEDTIITVLARHSGVPAQNIKREAPLSDLGLNSFKFMVSLLEIQKGIGRQFLTVENLASIQTLEDLLAVVRVAPSAGTATS